MDRVRLQPPPFSPKYPKTVFFCTGKYGSGETPPLPRSLPSLKSEFYRIPKHYCFKKNCFWYGNIILFHILSLDARSFILKRFEMIVSRSNEETLKWLKEIKWSKMTEENLTKEAGSFFGVLKTKRTETVRAKISDYVEKHHNLRQKILLIIKCCQFILL